MTLIEYKRKFESDLEEIWNDRGRYQFLNRQSFIYSMWSNRKLQEDEDL